MRVGEAHVSKLAEDCLGLAEFQIDVFETATERNLGMLH